MQPTLNLLSNSNSQLPYSWKPYKIHLLAPRITIPTIRTETSLKPLSLSISLQTSFGHEFERESQDTSTEKKAAASTRLPIVVHRSGTVSRYVWQEDELKLVSADEDALSLSSFCIDLEDGFRRLFRMFGLAVRNFFLPRYVSENYLEYVKWKLLHRVFSSALQVLATQAMLRAIGIGHSRSLPSAAALNWVLKDGLGRLCRCLYTASLASAFDTNLKRVRFMTSVLFSLSIGVELLTPIFPHHFLLLASLANIAKQISLACYLATGSAVHRSFAITDNLGEVSAKSQIQTVCFDNLGLMLAATLDILFQKNQRLQRILPFLLYPIFTTFDLYGIYKGMKHVHLQTLTKDRLEIIMNTWIRLRYVPSPEEVSNKEGIGFPLVKGSDSLWPIRIGWLNPKDKISNLTSATMMQSMKQSDFYFICIEVSRKFLRTKQKQILICLREGACSSDIIMGVLEACYIRNAILSGMRSWEINLANCDSHFFDLAIREWFKLIEKSKGVTIQELTLLTENMVRLGWTTKNILLSTEEQSRYGFVDN